MDAKISSRDDELRVRDKNRDYEKRQIFIRRLSGHPTSAESDNGRQRVLKLPEPMAQLSIKYTVGRRRTVLLRDLLTYFNAGVADWSPGPFVEPPAIMNELRRHEIDRLYRI